jgi:hypothetical protein
MSVHRARPRLASIHRRSALVRIPLFVKSLARRRRSFLSAVARRLSLFPFAVLLDFLILLLHTL